MKKVKFSEILEFKKKSPLKAGEGVSDGIFPFFTSSPTISKFSNTYQFDSASLIFGTGGSASVHISTTPFSVSTDCLVAQLRHSAVEEFDIKFVYYFLFGNIWILEEGFKGAGLRHISKSYIDNIEIPKVPLVDQKLAVNNLDRAQLLTANRSKSLIYLDQYLKTVFYQMFGNSSAATNGWPVVELDKLCSDVVDCPHSTPEYLTFKSDFPCIRSSDMQDGFLDFSTTKYVDQNQYIKRTQRSVPIEGDIIYCREGARFGACAYLPANISACLGQRTMLFRAKKEVATSEYLWGLMNSEIIKGQAARLVKGAASPHINVKQIKKYLVSQPPLELQKHYSRIYHGVVACKKDMSDQSVEIDSHFHSVMQKVFKATS